MLARWALLARQDLTIAAGAVYGTRAAPMFSPTWYRLKPGFR